MASTHFYVKDKKSKSKTLISLYWRIPDGRFVYSTGEHVKPSNWSFNKERVLHSHPLSNVINSKLDRINKVVLSEYEKLAQKKGFVKREDLKKSVDIATGEQKSENSLYAYFEKFRKDKLASSKFKKQSIKPYDSAMFNLKLYAESEKIKEIDFADIDYLLWQNFEEFLLKRDLSNNYANKVLSKTISILRQATKEGFNKNREFENFDIGIKEEETTAIYLNKNEVNELHHLDLSKNKRLDSARDIFLSGIYTGLRHSDFSKIKRDNIRIIDGFNFLSILSQKGEEVGIIPVNEKLIELIDKHGGSMPVISSQNLNDYIKEVGKMCGLLQGKVDKVITKGGRKKSTTFIKYEMLTTHTARRTFATNAYLDGWDLLSIRMITGHSSDALLLKYIRVTKQENALRVAKANQSIELKRISDVKESIEWLFFNSKIDQKEKAVLDGIIKRL